MSEILFQYQKVEPTTWAYLSSLLIIGLYFKFNRFWSVRNLDLCLIILLAPGLLMVYYGEQLSRLPQAAAVVPAGDAPPAMDVGPDNSPPPEQPQPNQTPPAPSELDKSSAPAESPEKPPANETTQVSPDRFFVYDETDSLPLSPENQLKRELATRKAYHLIQATTDSEVVPSEGEPKPEVTPPVAADPVPPAVNPAVVTDKAAVAELDQLLARLPNLSPEKARSVMHFGYLWLLGVSLLLLVRLLCDPTMVRRPLLEPNLSNGGLLFIGCALLFFLLANLLTSEVSSEDLNGSQGAQAIINAEDTSANHKPVEAYYRVGPGYYMLLTLPSIPTLPFGRLAHDDPRVALAPAARTMAIISHLSVVIALVIVGLWHFDNVKLGIGAAALYLMLPYTAQMTGHIDHVLPSALMLWAVVFYRRPALAGIFIGLSVGVVYYPLFLLPLWISFYWQRGVLRFLLGLIGAIAVTAISLAFVSEDMISFWSKIRQMFGLFLPNMDAGQLRGVWERSFGWDPIYRLPCIALSICLSASFAIWPAQKNLGTLLSCSAAMMLAVQFWHGYGGGTYIAWFMPLMLLTVFRPNLEDRIALTVLGEGWLSKRRSRLAPPLGRAA
ncbi:glycosyltransferase family 87 protein [Anatilimnocola sp. NA78]|uniref:glycosyltransferase family 87 protein n=1 Tax=Anatilimnocola sp. NA78 TaxID=3415683 RepID=UPI003CE50D0B